VHKTQAPAPLVLELFAPDLNVLPVGLTLAVLAPAVFKIQAPAAVSLAADVATFAPTLQELLSVPAPLVLTISAHAPFPVPVITLSVVEPASVTKRQSPHSLPLSIRIERGLSITGHSALRVRGTVYQHRPFQGSGTSLYATVGSAVQYRNFRVFRAVRGSHSAWIKGTAGNHDIAAASVPKTARRTSVSDPTEELTWDLPAEFASQTVTFDVRRYDTDVENETQNWRTAAVELDANRDDATEILGTATLLNQEVRAGGIVRLRFTYHPHRSGVQPTVFAAIRTAGPTSVVESTVTVAAGTRLVEIDTPVLSDASPYTYKLQARNSSQTITKDLLTGISVQADATGPPVPTAGVAQAW